MRAKASTVLLVADTEITAFLLSSQSVFQASVPQKKEEEVKEERRQKHQGK